MRIYLYGPIGRVIILVLAIFGFVLALGDVLDAYDANWKVTVPLTVIYAVLIWRFALSPAEDEFMPKGGWALAFYLVMKLGMTIALLLLTLGVVALAYDLFRLVADNWPYVVMALVIIALIIGWALLPERKNARKRGASTGRAAPEPPPGSDDLIT